MRMRVLLFALCMVPLLPARAATYYVDAEHGSDSNNGTSPITAWKSINKLNQQKFVPGDAILFRRGQIWREQLNLQSSLNRMLFCWTEARGLSGQQAVM